jgi:hypothetical protein
VVSPVTFRHDWFLFSTGYRFCALKATVDLYLGLGLACEVLENVTGLKAEQLYRL